MQHVSNDNFGPLVAYLIPGTTVLVGLRPYFPSLQNWLASTPPHTPTVGGFLYLTLAALAAGMTVSAVRWAIVDTIHASTGLAPPSIDFSRLNGNVDGLALLIDIHYRHYQFYANALIAIAIAYTAHRAYYGFDRTTGWLDVGVMALETVFFLTSRDTLRLCGRPHNRSYVTKLIMWRWPVLERVPSDCASFGRHITDRLTAFAGTRSAPWSPSTACDSSFLPLHSWPTPWPWSPDRPPHTHWSSSATRGRAMPGSC